MNDVQKYFSFVKWTPAQIKKNAYFAFENKKKTYERIASQDKNAATFESVLEAIDDCEKEYESVMTPIDHLMYVSVNKKVRTSVQEIQERLSKSNIELMQDSRLYFLIKGIYRKYKNKLKGEQYKLLEDFYLVFKRMGFDLDSKKQNRIKKIKSEIMKLEIEYQKTLDEWKEVFVVDKKRLDGLPQDILNSLYIKNGNAHLDVVMSTYVIIMKYCNDVQIRKAYAEKFSRVGGAKNVSRLSKIIQLRNDLAQILGYKNYAEYSHELKMSQKTSTVIKFLSSLEKSLKSSALRDIKNFEKKVGEKMTYYNFPYHTRIEKQSIYSINENEAKNYFELENVKNGCFRVIENIFSVKFRKNEKCNLWHKDVELYEIIDSDGEIVSCVTLDLFRRDGKYSHEAAAGAVHLAYKEKDGNRKVPILCFLMNLDKNRKEKVTLLTYRQVITFFHEMGHVMHHSFQNNTYVSHYSSEPDFAELPSQWLEQYAKNYNVLSSLALHYKTGDKMPKKMIENLILSDKFFLTHSYLTQVYYSLADIELYTKSIKDIAKYFNTTLEKNGIMLYEKSIKVANFTHLASNYGANYYSYLWSLVYAIDAFKVFSSKKLFDKKLGQDFRSKVLSPGSSRKEIKMIRDFLGREPSNEAFLKELGI